MPDFNQQDLAGARFRFVRLRDARFHEVDLSGAVIRGAYASSLELAGDFGKLLVNGVDVMPLVEAELNRRDPDRAAMRPSDPAGFRRAWQILERRWQQTVDRARELPEPLLHERVDGEWSFIETLRHLSFATDAWVVRAVLGEAVPWHPLDLPHDDMPDSPGVPRDRDARPSLDEVLAVRAGRTATMRRVLAELTDEKLDSSTEPVTEPGYPEPESYSVRDCLSTILNEEWEHHTFAERDLAVLTPVVVAATWAWVRDGRLLVVRPAGQDAFFLPGGTPEAGETLAETTAREVEEETGLRVPAGRFTQVLETVLPAYGRPGTNVRLVCFTAPPDAVPDREPVPTSEIEEVAWITAADAHRCAPALQAVIPQLLPA
ncbi:DinB family protein [Actinoplanes sp. NPDC051494]|uniref:DinB family protein n=1 Tax=Actinoplanes sp. NPDC051494 TaxID=3363907 RepID=UPI0037AECAD3